MCTENATKLGHIERFEVKTGTFDLLEGKGMEAHGKRLLQNIRIPVCLCFIPLELTHVTEVIGDPFGCERL